MTSPSQKPDLDESINVTEAHGRMVRESAAAAREKRIVDNGTEPVSLGVVLACELPERGWQCVRVNPADADAAARRFPGAVVETDPGISGGMEVECEDGRVRISNTLEARLEAAWPDLLPRLIAELETRSPPHGLAA